MDAGKTRTYRQRALNQRAPQQRNKTQPATQKNTAPRANQSFLARISDIVNSVARNSPARLALIVFVLIIIIFTILLELPAATTTGRSAPLVDAFFTATSAVCVTGLVTVNTAMYWSGFGQFVIMIGMAIGGLGVMTLASILGMAVSRRIGLTQKFLAAGETKSRLGEVGSLIKTVIIVALSAQIILFFVLIPFFHNKGDPLLSALWHSLFMAVSIFNNGGFVIMPEGLTPYVGEWTLVIPIIFGTFAGAIGFPVIMDMSRNVRRPNKWNLTTKLTLVTYLLVFVFSAVAIGLLEWWNPATFGDLSVGERIAASALHAADARSSGLATVDIGNMNQTTWFLLDILMFIGGGSASTAGGIKVTTLAVLVLAVVAEARGDRDTEAFGKRLPPEALRLAIAAVLMGAILVGTGTIALLQMTDFELSQILFEVISAFGTCGLSTGITAALPESAKWVLIILMFAGRTGTMTLAAALALRARRRVIRLPEERPIIG